MAAITTAGFDAATTKTVILTTGENFPDALAAAGLAGIASAPIITTTSAELSVQARQMIVRFDPTTIYLLGEGSAVSSDIERRLGLEFPNCSIKRLAGADRYATSLALYREGGSNWGSTAIVACGEKFPDALSVSPFSYASRSPIFLASSTSGLTAEAAAALRTGGFTQVLLLGGIETVPKLVEVQLAGMNLKRLAGSDRYQTSVLIAEYSIAALEGTLAYSGPIVATGLKPYDALSGGVFAGKTGNVLVLTDDSPAGCYALNNYLAVHRQSVGHVFVLGSGETLADSLVEKIRASVR
jgi:putative cell wall-binding protein